MSPSRTTNSRNNQEGPWSRFLKGTADLLTVITAVSTFVALVFSKSNVEIRSGHKADIKVVGRQILLTQLVNFSNKKRGEGSVNDIEARIFERATDKLVCAFISVGFVELNVEKEMSFEKEITFEQVDETINVSLFPGVAYVIEYVYHVKNQGIIRDSEKITREYFDFELTESKAEQLRDSIGGFKTTLRLKPSTKPR